MRVRNGPGSTIRYRHSLGLYILSRAHFDKCRRNGPGWGMVQDKHSLGFIHSLQGAL
jgi:hypothetical protein